MFEPNKVSLVLKVSEICNMNCNFCYYSNNTISSVTPYMQKELCKLSIEEAAYYNLKKDNNKLEVIFHGGEPLLAGLDFFYDIIKFEKELARSKYKEFTFINSLQTNGYLLDQSWITFFQENNFSVGISVDGDKEVNFHKSNKDINYGKIISDFNAARINYGVLSVITDQHKGHAEDYYRFCVDNKIKSVGINYCINKKRNIKINLDNMVDFTIDLFNLYFFNSYPLRIREFDCAIESIILKNSSLCSMNKRKSCGKYLTVDTEGRVFFCDYAYDKKRNIGSIVSTSLKDIINGERYQQEWKDSQSILEKCKKCNVFNICGGGCFRNDIPIEAEYENNFCKAYKRIFQHISEIVNTQY